MIIFGWNGWQNLHSRSSGNEFLKFSPSTFLSVLSTIILVRWPWRLVISFINDQMWNDSKFIANLIVKWEWHFHRNSRRLIRWPLTALTIWNIYPQFNLWAQLANWFKSWIIVLSWTEFTIFSSCTFVKKNKICISNLLHFFDSIWVPRIFINLLSCISMRLHRPSQVYCFWMMEFRNPTLPEGDLHLDSRFKNVWLINMQFY